MRLFRINLSSLRPVPAGMEGCIPRSADHSCGMVATVHSKFVRRVSGACLGLWVVAFITCSLHCTLGSFSARAQSSDHSCCAQSSPSSADAPAKSAPNKNCQTFRDLTVSESSSPRAEFTPHVIAVLVPFLVDALASPKIVEVKPSRSEPDSGPPSHIPLMRLAGRAPPALV